jgi:hypothetical protein
MIPWLGHRPRVRHLKLFRILSTCPEMSQGQDPNVFAGGHRQQRLVREARCFRCRPLLRSSSSRTSPRYSTSSSILRQFATVFVNKFINICVLTAWNVQSWYGKPCVNTPHHPTPIFSSLIHWSRPLPQESINCDLCYLMPPGSSKIFQDIPSIYCIASYVPWSKDGYG